MSIRWTEDEAPTCPVCGDEVVYEGTLGAWLARQRRLAGER